MGIFEQGGCVDDSRESCFNSLRRNIKENYMGRKEANINEASKKLSSRWTSTVLETGWTGIPNILIERQQTLKLSPVEMNILIILLKYWWDKDNHPFPSKRKIADMVGRSHDTVRKTIKSMEEKGLVTRERRYYPDNKGQKSNYYKLDGLVAKLEEYAKEKKDIKETREIEDARKRRGH